MRAIILAGGEGTRLLPVTAALPKPMAELLDRPALSYVLELLRRSGVSEARVALRCMPEMIKERFGSRSDGVRLSYSVENTPRGTAGCSRDCLAFANGEDVIIAPGDCVCDFDIRPHIAAHKRLGAAVTLLLTRCAQPTEYGLVNTAADGRVVSFCEKPAWESVTTDLVNTGIYIVSPETLALVPETGEYDFGRELFPRLLDWGAPLYAFEARGYWRDVGSPEALRECCGDILTGKTRFIPDAPETQPGVYCAGRADGVRLYPPVYIGRGAKIERGASVGPLAVIGGDARIATGAEIRESVIMGGRVGAGAYLNGAIVCRGASVGENATVLNGSVLGENSSVGGRASVINGARLWLGASVEANTVTSEDVRRANIRKIEFGTAGIVTLSEPGEAASQIRRLGAVAASFGRVGTASDGSRAGEAAACIFTSSLLAGGCTVLGSDAAFAAESAFFAAEQALPVTAFFEALGGGVRARFFGPDGAPIPRETERKLLCPAHPPITLSGEASAVTGTRLRFCQKAADLAGSCGGLRVAVSGAGEAVSALRLTLRLCGAELTEEKGGAPVFVTSEDGFSLEISQRGGRDATKEETPLLAALTGCREPVSAAGLAASICAYLHSENITLSDALSRVPGRGSASCVVPATSGRARVMGELRELCGKEISVSARGLRLEARAGTALLSPLRDREAISIRAEARDAQAAGELCASAAEMIARLDGSGR